MADFTNENNKEFRPLILKLGQKITDRLGRKITPDDPEYWVLPSSPMRWQRLHSKWTCANR